MCIRDRSTIWKFEELCDQASRCPLAHDRWEEAQAEAMDTSAFVFADRDPSSNVGRVAGELGFVISGDA